MKSTFKFKIGDVVCHKADGNYRFVILTRMIIAGVSGGKSPWYYCSNVVCGIRKFAEVELETVRIKWEVKE